MNSRNFTRYDRLPSNLRQGVKADMLRAKGGCKHCHGSGMVGVRVIGDKRNTVLCRCVVVDMDIFKEAYDEVPTDLPDAGVQPESGHKDPA